MYKHERSKTLLAINTRFEEHRFHRVKVSLEPLSETECNWFGHDQTVVVLKFYFSCYLVFPLRAQSADSGLRLRNGWRRYASKDTENVKVAFASVFQLDMTTLLVEKSEAN